MCLKHRTLLDHPGLRPRPALFLDRDGVIIQDYHHLSDPAAVDLCPGIRRLIGSAAASDWAVVVVTNQSGIARGLFSWQEYELVNRRMLELLGQEAPLSAIYACGDGPDAGERSWRKPSPAMILDARDSLKLDLSHSVLVGDRLSDLQAGMAAGVAQLCHVETGHGMAERAAVVTWYDQLKVAAQTTTRLQLLCDLTEFEWPLL